MKTPLGRAGALKNEALRCCGGPEPSKADAYGPADALPKDHAEAGGARGAAS
jgi:hypothetical protein